MMDRVEFIKYLRLGIANLKDLYTMNDSFVVDVIKTHEECLDHLVSSENWIKESRNRIAELEKENAALRQMVHLSTDCPGHLIDKIEKVLKPKTESK